MTHDRRELARDVAIIFVLALGARLILALSLPANDTVSWDQSYWEYARNFSEGRGFWMPNPYSAAVNLPRVYAFRPPLFPFAWGCVFRLTHGAYAPIRIAFAFLGAATCAIAYLAGIELTGKRVVAALAGILCAFYPPLDLAQRSPDDGAAVHFLFGGLASTRRSSSAGRGGSDGRRWRAWPRGWRR